MIARLFILLILVSGFQAYAAEAPKSTPLTRLNDATKKMLTGLDKNQTLQFAAIRNNHGIIRAVEDVEDNITSANTSCSKAHPEFANAMNTRVDQWKADIDPLLVQARDKLSTMIKLQDFAKPAEARGYLKQIDEAVAYKNRNLKLIPITDKEECRKLLVKMDDTQEDLKKLLVESMDLDKPIAQ